MLVSLSRLLADATARSYAIGAFNTINLEMTLAIIRAATATRSPVIIQTTENAFAYAGDAVLAKLILTLVEDPACRVPIAVHLDHGKSLETVKRVIKLGYNSAMLDASHESFAVNVKKVRSAVRYAHRRRVAVQGEIGRIFGKEDWQNVTKREELLTRPEEALQFVKKTGVDTLAVSLGTAHGLMKQYDKHTKDDIDLPRLKAIHAAIPATPIVLHGGSGVSSAKLRAGIKQGIRIVNIDTDLRIAFTSAERKLLKADTKVFDPRKVLSPAIAAVEKVVAAKIKVLGSAGKSPFIIKK